MEGGVAGREIADQPILGAIQRIAGIHLRLGDGRRLIGRDPGAGLVVKRLPQQHAVQLQRREIINRMNGDHAVIVGGITLHRLEAFMAALAVALEIHAAWRLAVMLLDQEYGDVMGLLQLVAAEIAQGLGVGGKSRGVFARLGFMAAVAAESGIALAQRQRLFRIGKSAILARHQPAIVTAAAHLQRLAVPVGGKIELEKNIGRRGIDGMDGAQHFAESAVGGRGGIRRRGHGRAGGGKPDSAGGNGNARKRGARLRRLRRGRQGERERRGQSRNSHYRLHVTFPFPDALGAGPNPNSISKYLYARKYPRPYRDRSKRMFRPLFCRAPRTPEGSGHLRPAFIHQRTARNAAAAILCNADIRPMQLAELSSWLRRCQACRARRKQNMA